MSNSIVYKVVITMLCLLIITAGISFAAIIVKKELDLIQSENLCIQEWMRLGVERKDIYRNNGDCYFSKELNFTSFSEENLTEIPVHTSN
jgi:hypothetical protein